MGKEGMVITKIRNLKTKRPPVCIPGWPFKFLREDLLPDDQFAGKCAGAGFYLQKIHPRTQ
jgi:hypothetical protein